MLFTKQLKIMAAEVRAFVSNLDEPLRQLDYLQDRVNDLLDRFEAQGYVEFDVYLGEQPINVRVKLPRKTG